MNIMIAGEGGQGIQTIAKIIADLAYEHKINVSYIPHYGVEMRMSISFAFVRLSKTKISYPKFEHADILAILSGRDIEVPISFADQKTRIINAIGFSGSTNGIYINRKSTNMLVLGIILKELNTTDFRLDFNKVMEHIKKLFPDSPILNDNIKALQAGFGLSPEIYTRKVNRTQFNKNAIIDKDNVKIVTRFPWLCKGCGLCIEKCPKSALSFSNKNVNYIGSQVPDVSLEKCISCKICENICPDCAIKIDKKQ